MVPIKLRKSIALTNYEITVYDLSAKVNHLITPPGSEEENLREILDEAERRKAAEIKQAGGKFTLIVGVCVGSLTLWAAMFLIRYEVLKPPQPPPETIMTVPRGALADEERDIAQYDMFRPNEQRIMKSPVDSEEKGQIIGKEDIHFAMELLNFMHRPAEPKPAGH
jgi:hypothetical protein